MNAIATSIWSLGFIGVSLIFAVLKLGCQEMGPMFCPTQDGLFPVVIALFGALGAALTTAHALITSPLPTKYTEGAMSIAVTASRPLIGSASAIAVYYFLTSDFGAVVLGLKEIKQNTIFTVAFASGFSERLVFSTTKKVIDRVGK